MKLFSLIQLHFSNFYDGVRKSLGSMLSSYKENFGSNTIFGQLVNVLGSVTQNILTYIEDSVTEQNKYTAQRKRSIYNLASISGYDPSMGKATSAVVALTWKPNNTGTSSVVIPNHTKMLSSQTGMSYNIILPQESIVCSISADNSVKYLTVVEGSFETQSFVSTGGQLYSKNIKFSGDADLDYTEVWVNDEKWSRCDSLYDMDPEAKQYLTRTGLKTGFDVVFGNGQHGRALRDGDVVKVSYLIHGGELGNIPNDSEAIFTFYETLKDTAGQEVNGNELFTVELQSRDSINSGVFPDSVEFVRNMIGMNSRALVLADAKNYKKIFSKFSFIGYNRVWTEQGSMVVNSLIMKNYKAQLQKGSDYFGLTDADFMLNRDQKRSIYNAIAASGEQLAGVVFNIFDPEIVKYSAYIYVKLKDGDWDRAHIEDKIRDLVGQFFADIKSDVFVPKSDLIHLLKSEIDAIDGVDVYFLSEKNEEAMHNHYYTEKSYNYNPATGNYKIEKKNVFLYDDEDPGLGLDAHGNIWLDNNDQFPVLMGGWNCWSQANGTVSESHVTSPLTIIIEQ